MLNVNSLGVRTRELFPGCFCTLPTFLISLSCGNGAAVLGTGVTFSLLMRRPVFSRVFYSQMQQFFLRSFAGVAVRNFMESNKCPSKVYPIRSIQVLI